MTTPKYKPGSRVCLIDDPAITGTIVRDSFVYEKLPKKLEQLKKDMKRGCEIFCKEENGT